MFPWETCCKHYSYQFLASRDLRWSEQRSLFASAEDKMLVRKFWSEWKPRERSSGVSIFPALFPLHRVSSSTLAGTRLLVKENYFCSITNSIKIKVCLPFVGKAYPSFLLPSCFSNSFSTSLFLVPPSFCNYFANRKANELVGTKSRSKVCANAAAFDRTVLPILL